MLDDLFKPRTVAVVGASNNPLSIGNVVVRNLLDHGFKGSIFPINPNAAHVQGLKAYKSVLDVPDPISLANISVNAALVPDVLEQCGTKGVRFAIVHTAGYKEVGEKGLERERRIVSIAHKHGMRIVGPNSQGIQNSEPTVSVYANFTFVPMKPGGISILAQSGGIGEMLKLHLHNAGLGHRMYCSYGNECDLTMPEILDYFGQDDGTRVIMVQVESFKTPMAFLEVASRITPRKPIVAMKAGRTREGSAAVSSHTGMLVDQVGMATAMFTKAGVVEFRDTHQMIQAAIAMATQPVSAGTRIGIITNTGGPGIVAVDEAIEQGLVLATWSDQGKKRLAASLLPEASIGNPVDVVATAGADHYFAAIDTLVHDGGVDMVLVFFVSAPFVDLEAIATRIKDACSTAKKPVVVVIETVAKWYGLIHTLREAGIPVYEFAEDGARALAAMARHAELRSRIKKPPPDLTVDRETALSILKRYEGTDSFLSQADAIGVLAAYGISTPNVTFFRSKDDLTVAANKVGFPCVLKVDSANVIHKSSEGGVALQIHDANELLAAFNEMHARFSANQATYMLQEQKGPGCEVIVGTKASAALGSLVLFGLGGRFAEIMNDVVVAIAPLSRPETQEMIRGIKGYAALEDMRGGGVDFETLECLLLKVSRLAADFQMIAEMDLNPVLLYPQGTALAAVDVRIKVR